MASSQALRLSVGAAGAANPVGPAVVAEIPARNNHEIYRAITDHLIGDVSFRAFRVSRFRRSGHRRPISHSMA